tara:strand:+ start:2669 stop:3358 length:690 start_codon:yes stop_codon:yes gene_type:complete
MINKKIYCVIPARGGSKRIKNKNIVMFNKKPLIYYSINAAKKTNLFKKIVVSTDSNRIKFLSEKFGAVVPFKRAKSISEDKSSSIDVLKDVIKRINIKDDYIFFVYPTSPTINQNDLIKAWKKIKKEKADCLIAVKEYESNPLRSLVLDKNTGYLKFKFKKYQRKNSQDLPKLYQDSGSFYIFNIKSLMKSKLFIPKKTIAFHLKKYDYVDINDQEDLEFSQFLYKFKN